MRLQVTQKSFAKYNLKKNPFPNVGVPDDSVSVYSDREKELHTIEDAIVGTMQGSSSHVVIVGSYGNGKTATLKFIKGQIEKQLSNAVSIYLSYPGDTFLEFYRNLMYELGLDKMEYFVWSFLELVNKETDLKQKIEVGEVLITDIIEKGKKFLYNHLRYMDFATAFLKLTLDRSKFLSWKYLCGEPVVYEQRRELDVVTLIDTDEKALRAFMALKSILNLIGYKIICILVDELESIELLHPTRKQKVLNSIRRLIDLNPSGLCLIMACTPEAWSSIISDYHAFSERIFREVILKPLDGAAVREFIRTYLKVYRTDSDNKKPDIHPFTKDAIEQILIAAQGNLRRVLMICNRAIQKGCEVGFPLLTAHKLKEILPEVMEFQL